MADRGNWHPLYDQGIQWDEGGNPFYLTSDSQRDYVPPIAAAQYQNDPKMLAWAQGRGATIDYSPVQSGGAPVVSNNSVPSGSLLRERGTWNSQSGGYDQGLNWTNILSMAVAGFITAGAAAALMGGGPAAESAVSTAMSTGDINSALAAGEIGMGPGMGAPIAGGAATSAATGTGVGLGETGAISGLTGATLPGLTAAPAVGAALPAATTGLASALPGATTPAVSDLASTSSSLTGMDPGTLNTLVSTPSRGSLVSSLTSPNAIASIASGGLGLIGSILQANAANNANAQQDAYKRQLGYLNTFEMNPVAQNVDLAKASSMASVMAHGPSRLGVTKPFDMSQAQAFLTPEALAQQTARFTQGAQDLGTNSISTAAPLDLAKMGFGTAAAPYQSLTGGPKPPETAIPRVGPVPTSPTAAQPADPRRTSLVNSVAPSASTAAVDANNSIIGDPAGQSSPNDYFNRRRKAVFTGAV